MLVTMLLTCLVLRQLHKLKVSSIELVFFGNWFQLQPTPHHYQFSIDSVINSNQPNQFYHTRLQASLLTPLLHQLSSFNHFDNICHIVT